MGYPPPPAAAGTTPATTPTTTTPLPAACRQSPQSPLTSPDPGADSTRPPKRRSLDARDYSPSTLLGWEGPTPASPAPASSAPASPAPGGSLADRVKTRNRVPSESESRTRPSVESDFSAWPELPDDRLSPPPPPPLPPPLPFYPVGTTLRKQFDVGGAFHAGEVVEVGAEMLLVVLATSYHHTSTLVSLAHSHHEWPVARDGGGYTTHDTSFIAHRSSHYAYTRIV